MFENNIDWFGNHIEELVYAGEDLGINLAKQNNVEFIKLPQTDLNLVYDVVQKVILEQMADLDKKGLDGTAVYNFMRSKIKEYSK